jgi:hypothetical protein
MMTSSDVGGDLEYLHIRNGLGELFSAMFMTRTLRSVVQVRAERQDKSMEDHSKIRGVEIDLRTLEFKGLQDIEGKLDELTKQGIYWDSFYISEQRCYLGEIWFVVQ